MNSPSIKRKSLQNNRIWNRKDKHGYVNTYIDSSNAPMLEIGPSIAPLWSAQEFPNLRYLETVDAEGLKERAKGKPNQSNIEEVHYIFQAELGFEGSIKNSSGYEYVCSSHVIEHIPDFIEHIQSIERVCAQGGYYFAITPDKNMIFDKARPSSSLGDMVSYHYEGKTSLSAAIDTLYYAVETDNEKHRGWWNSNDKDDLIRRSNTKQVKAFDIDKFISADINKWNGHFHVFDPISFAGLIDGMRMMGLTNMSLCDVVTTGHMDFIAVLKKDDGASNLNLNSIYESLASQNYPFLAEGGLRNNVYKRSA